jgi:hypothetical protein
LDLDRLLDGDDRLHGCSPRGAIASR